MYSILKKEIANYFNAYTGFLAIALFLLITGLLCWIFPDTAILDAGYANLDSFFNLAPYVFLFLIPAICMRSIAGEKADGTYDLLLSRPISIRQLILGKFFGALVILILAILPTIIYPISLYFLANPIGNIDTGAIIGSYIGLLFLGIAFIAISIFCSSVSKNPIVAFLLAIFVCFFFYYAFDAISGFSALYAFVYEIKSFGIQEHYFNISRGVLTGADLIYFISLSAIFLLFSIGHLNRQYTPTKKTLTVYLGVLVFAFIVNQPFITSLLGRLDFTADKRFTLSETSKNTVKEVKKHIQVTIFLDGDLPNGFSRLKNSAVELLSNLRSYSNGMLSFNVINPLEGTDKERQDFSNALIQRGLYPTNLNVKSEGGLSQKAIFPWAIVGDGENEIAVNLLQTKMGAAPEEVLNNSVQNLEYAVTSALKKLNSGETPYIAFSEGHGEPNDLELYDAMQSLMASGQVGRINLNTANFKSLDQLSLLVIAKPQQAFTEAEKYKIDYYVRNGGRIIWAIDPIDASLDHIRKSGSQPLVTRQLNLDDQLFTYGVRINYDLIADLNCSQIPVTVGNISGQPQIELAPWYFFPILVPTSQSSLVKNLDGIRTEFISTIDTVASKNIKKEIILTSSPFSKLISPPNQIGLEMLDEQPDPTKFKSKPMPVAVMLQGKFPYLYENRQAPEGIQEKKELSSVSKEAKMFVMADGDWLINQINQADQSPFPLGWDRYTQQQFANKTLLNNLVDYMLFDESLIALRAREVKLRLLDQAKVKTDKVFWQIINVAAPIILLFLFAVIQQWMRKRKYAKA
ncbi:gliding motility-associated ABC transporter substrate-binding protein GldG [Sphingobacterium sp. DK4209]|uniref:Gliding motility-associated ABC transporter substrate-binding protein GldG n=1 Tax=Sphingobacterium zhuxiongii TaxID=2662364 RepID=A0A5Q0Q637_9SPHI|nr:MULTISPECIES: gliding motility-associated ABC transporter substrate-binding protein GldG [unclassified Sphingobacterium]MVZ66892.1 gliding motility-associated ABC transporter substrate-binding protein GldG [Sphingobacterium sp. DK4209]QGA25535.1 gliding motility-associated ABC transporter substrate-binding protein GldG [Sphingobacterium sp. dk4302]